ncbi:DUF1858 domain-containing protein [Mesorhizobium sp. L-8-10]|uniref:DUF1858 domain-containing protein n=1 Tax=Mesorhizobium sp. L-8-10 TaxID=2744523 RepID=UPI00406CA98E
MNRRIVLSEDRKRTDAVAVAAMDLFSDDMTVDEVMRRWPSTIRVFLRHGMLCVGCPIASFHTIPDAAREHGLDEVELRRELESAVSS